MVGFGPDHGRQGFRSIEQPPLRDGPLRHVAQVGVAQQFQLAGLFQLLQSVVADGQQHVEAWFVVGRGHLAQ